MQSLFGLELSTAQKVIVASVVILVLLALLGLFVRQIQGGRLRLRGQASGRQRQPRLGVVDTYDLDRQRQLVLIRRDNIEHLLMIGGASDVVVETNILRSGGRAATSSYADAGVADRPLPPFETLVPPSEPAMRAGEEARRAGLAPEGPELLPPLPTRPVSVPVEPATTAAAATVATAGVAAALGVAAAAEAVASPAKPAMPAMPVPPLTTGPAPSFAREHAPQPAVSAGELDDMTRQLEEALKRPFSAVRPANLGNEAPAASPAPAVEPPAPAEKFSPPPVVEEEDEVPPVEAVAPFVEPPAPEPEIVPEPAPVPVAPPAPVAAAPRQKLIPSDVEAELAAALGLALDRPLSKAPEPMPLEAKPLDAKFSEAKSSEVKSSEAKPAELHHPQPSPAPEPIIEDETVIEETVLDAVVEEPVPVEAAKPKPEPEKVPEPAPKEIDPFSVDAIEAEFARLLGRDPKAKS
ncbi:flagellar biosynthetic protein FliO [uncultured Bosea sp.]|uniref:flagellar biosynthetic protein FliO n=1 Tax=uncultured Bosea sp. TaxID=211457 RepID=UPI00263B27C4|nr:flagellar biosynthetic protein FliO [uncultured Bosea sp.]